MVDLKEVRVLSPTHKNCETFTSERDDRLDADVVAVGSAEAAVSGADVFACGQIQESGVRPKHD